MKSILCSTMFAFAFTAMPVFAETEINQVCEQKEGKADTAEARESGTELKNFIFGESRSQGKAAL